MSLQTINNAEIVEIGLIKKSRLWTNVYIKFKNETGEILWFYYSEHVNKPERLKQIPDIEKGIIKVGTKATVNYTIQQAQNKSTSFRIKDISNYHERFEF